MSDETTAPASSAEQMIPKSRLDELIAQRNQLQQQTNFMQQTLSTLVQQQKAQRGPEPDEVEMEKLREENPAVYKSYVKQKKQENELKQVRAGFASVADELDRMKFIQATGKAGQKMLQRVEEILGRERSNGNFNADRHGIYTYLLGSERLVKEAQGVPNQQSAAVESVEEDDSDIPSSNPKFASTIAGNTASSKTVEKSREDRIKDIENIVF